MKQISDEDKILKDILAGKYKEYYVIYSRKSTDDTNNQKNSLEYQHKQNFAYAKGHGLPIAPVTVPRLFTDGEVREKHSSFKENDGMIFNGDGTVTISIERPKFYRMVELLNAKLFKGVIFYCWDRASRNPTDSNIIKKLKKNKV